MQTRQGILVLDDDPTVARSLSRVLREHAEVFVAPSVAAAVPLWKASIDWIAFFVDVCLPDGSGLEALASARAAHPRVPTMVLTAFVDPTVANTAFDLGAVILAKPWTVERVNIFMGAARSRPRSVDEALGLVAREHALPPGELDILRRLVAGETVPQIATARGTSELTVRKQIASLRWRLGAESVQELMSEILRFSLPA